jgi:hypothetical protein
MFETTLATTMVVAMTMTPAVTSTIPRVVQPAQGQAAPALTAAELAPYQGDWTLTLQGPNGPGSFELSIRMEKDKPQADITSEATPKQPIADFTMAGKTLSLGYSFTWEGSPVSAVVSMTPSAAGPMTAQIDFAGGAYVMTGTAAKKEKK